MDQFEVVREFFLQLTGSARVSGAVSVTDRKGSTFSMRQPLLSEAATNAQLSTIATLLDRPRMGQIAPIVDIKSGALSFFSEELPLGANRFVTAMLAARPKNIVSVHHFGEMCTTVARLEKRRRELFSEGLEFVSFPPPGGGHRLYAPVRNGDGRIFYLYELYVPKVPFDGREFHWDVRGKWPGWFVGNVAEVFEEPYESFEFPEYVGGPKFSFFTQIDPGMRIGVMGRDEGPRWLPLEVERQWEE